MRKPTGTGYPHQNLDSVQRESLDRLHAPRFEFTRYWTFVELTNPDGKGVMFYPRRRRTWALFVKGYPVIVIQGRVVE